MLNVMKFRQVILGLFMAVMLCRAEALAGGAFRYHLPDLKQDPRTWTTVVGFVQTHVVKPKETFLDIARRYGLGYNEIQLLYPDVDPWIPDVGMSVVIPSRWVLPRTRKQDIVLNLPEMRLYHFFRKQSMVKTYPVGIGDRATQTPQGTFRVVERVEDPTWVIPASLRAKYPGVLTVPPGEENPLGKFWLGLSCEGYGIHGTNFPWCVGRSVSNGCVRMYPEHIRQFYAEVFPGAAVEIVYEPVKVGFLDGKIFVEVHEDVYGMVPDGEEAALQRLQDVVDLGLVSMESLREALAACSGLPVVVGSVDEDGGGT